MLRGGELHWPDTCAPGLLVVDAPCAWPQDNPTGSSTAASSKCSPKQGHAVKFRTLPGQACALLLQPPDRTRVLERQPTLGQPTVQGAMRRRCKARGCRLHGLSVQRARAAGSPSQRAPASSGATCCMARTWSRWMAGAGRPACTTRRRASASWWSTTGLTLPSSRCTGSRRRWGTQSLCQCSKLAQQAAYAGSCAAAALLAACERRMGGFCAS